MNVLLGSSLSFILYLISLLPFRFLYVLSDILFVILYHIIGYRKSIVRTNLANSFPEKTDSERKQIEKKFFQFLCDMVFEVIKLRSASATEVAKRFKILNIEEIQQHTQKNKSVLIVTGHYTNWEWGGTAAPLYSDVPLMIIYKSQSNKYFENILNRIRSRFGAIMVSMQQTVRQIISYPKPFLAVFLSDQTPVKNESNFFTNFLNQPTAIFLGIEKIAKKTGYPVVFLHIKRVKRGYQEGIFKTIVKNPKSTNEHEITKLHTAELEQVIRQNPEFWLWSHKRWKFKPQDIL